METTRDSHDPVELARMLGESIDRINILFAFKKSIRRITIVLVITTVIDIVITVAIALFFSFLHSAQVNACHVGNGARKDQIILWQGVVDKFGPKHPTASQISKDKQFIAFTNRIFRPVNCEKIYGSSWHI